MSDSRPALVVLPAPVGWESWHPGEGGAWTMVAEAPPEEKPWVLAKNRGPWVLGLPASTLQTMALRVPAAAEEEDEMIGLRLEAAAWNRGSDGEVLVDWRVSPTASGSEAGVFAWSFESNLLEGCPGGRTPVAVSPAFLFTSWPENRMVLWQEQARWMLALTSGSAPVHIQPCDGFHDPATLAADLRAQVASLLFRRLAAAPVAFVVAGEPVAGMAETAAELGLPFETTPRLPMQAPEAKSRLKPKQLLEAEKARVEASRWKKRIAVAAALWLAFASWAGWQHFQASRNLESAKIAAAAAAPRAAYIREVQTVWDQIDAVNGIDAFPLETLVRLSEVIPSRDVRLTQFVVDPKRDVAVKGSATNPQAALGFVEKVRRAKPLGTYSWQDPVTTPEKDGTATFTMTGKFKGGAR